MDSIEDIIATVGAGVPDLKSGSISFFGEVFGGRIDNIHTIVGATAGLEGEVVIRFDGGEALHVWSPDHAVVSSADVRFGSAARVRWEWTSYGSPATPENRLFLDYLVTGAELLATTNAPWALVKSRVLAVPEAAAAEIVWF